MPPQFSVITPTYNRRHTLIGVYDGLKRQTFRDFEWIIVDDGSTDDTGALVGGWKANFPIVYEKTENRGKPSALNLGLARSTGRYLLVLDSDDVPVDDALEVFARELGKSADDVCAVGSLTMTPDGKIIGSELGAPVVETTMLDAYARRGMKGDKWLAFIGAIAKTFAYPKYGDEKFIGEGLVFNRMARAGYKTRFINVPLLIHGYRPDGLTQNTLRLKATNPVGFLALHTENISAGDAAFRPYYLKSASNINAIILLASKRPFVTALLMIAGLPVGIVKGLIERHRLRTESKKGDSR